nr:myosin IC heavy chain-like isoform X1 [Caretta caretta]
MERGRFPAGSARGPGGGGGKGAYTPQQSLRGGTAFPMRLGGGPAPSRRAPRAGMAGASEPRLSAAEFERVKLSYLETITQELQEAAGLMGQLDRNLSAWARRAGQPEALAQVSPPRPNGVVPIPGPAGCHVRGPGAPLPPAAQPSPAPTPSWRETGAARPARGWSINAGSGLGPPLAWILLAAPRRQAGQ